jgi:DNA helicase-2/ATP-dependent DNA helicase PcrA
MNNRVVIASAGSGKTTFLVKAALAHPQKRIAVLTYTNNNVREIKKKFCEQCGCIPEKVDVMTWFSFLLRECTRPYQRSVYSERRVRTIAFPDGRSAPYAGHDNTKRYYFRNDDEIYSDKVSRFVIDCETLSRGLMTERLADIYDALYIDEIQDLAGWDLDVLELLLRSSMNLLLVGDPRQCTYTTNNAAKHSRYRGKGFLDLAAQWEKAGLCAVEHLSRSYRCNGPICAFADRLWPEMAATESLNTGTTGHDGLFLVSETNVSTYLKRFKPDVLRYSRSTANTHGCDALNFGDSKGLEFTRVLILPHGPIKKYLRSGDLKDVEKSLEKLYVAVTRAKHSVGFVYAGKCALGLEEWTPDGHDAPTPPEEDSPERRGKA